MPTKPPSQRGTRQQQQRAYDQRRGSETIDGLQRKEA
jgi:hypothetical protein